MRPVANAKPSLIASRFSAPSRSIDDSCASSAEISALVNSWIFFSMLNLLSGGIENGSIVVVDQEDVDILHEPLQLRVLEIDPHQLFLQIEMQLGRPRLDDGVVFIASLAFTLCLKVASIIFEPWTSRTLIRNGHLGWLNSRSRASSL